MKDQQPDEYSALNKNERRIVNLFLKNGLFCVVSRAFLEAELCGKKGMNQRTLTDRLEYLVMTKGLLFQVGNDKGAVGYGPRFLLDNPEWNRMIGENVDAWSPRKTSILKLNVPCTRFSSVDEEIESFEKAIENAPNILRGTKKEKARIIRQWKIMMRERLLDIDEQDKAQ